MAGKNFPIDSRLGVVMGTGPPVSAAGEPHGGPTPRGDGNHVTAGESSSEISQKLAADISEFLNKNGMCSPSGDRVAAFFKDAYGWVGIRLSSGRELRLNRGFLSVNPDFQMGDGYDSAFTFQRRHHEPEELRESDRGSVAGARTAAVSEWLWDPGLPLALEDGTPLLLEGTLPAGPEAGSMADKATAVLTWLNTRYSTANADVTTLISRYLAENPNTLNDKTKVMKELIASAG